MSTPPEAANVALVRRLVHEIQQQGNFALIDELISPDWIDRTPIIPGQMTDRAAVHTIMHYLHDSLKDIDIDIEHCVCTGDIVATNKVMRGIQVGELFGVKPRELNGSLKVQFRIFDVMRVKDGLLVEHWGQPGPVTAI